MALYRIAQEALSNALKHTQAQTIVIQLRWQRDRVSLLIADNGCGFRRSPTLKENLGLVGMQERILGIGGSFHIRTSAGHGTTVRAACSLPQSCVDRVTAQHQLSEARV